MPAKQKKNNEVSLVRCDTSSGPIEMEFHREWSPNGYDRAMELFERGFFDSSHFFRVVPKFLVQFGISYTTDQDLKKFAHTQIPDDPKHKPVIPFNEGTISYAGSGDNSRTSQLFISYGSAKSLGTQKWETPVGKVVQGMDNVKNFYSGYGDGPPFGKGPAQGKIHSGRRYIEENFPLLDSFKTCTVQRGVTPVANVSDQKRIRDENQHESKHHKKQQQAAKMPNLTGNREKVPRLNDQRKQLLLPRRSDTWTHAFAAFAVIILVLLMIFGYRKSGRKGSKKS